MVKRWVRFCGLVIFLIGLTGCASLHKQKDLEMQGLRNQVTLLEAQIQNKDEQINSLKESLDKSAQAKEEVVSKRSKRKLIAEVKSRPKARQVQIALKNAGYDPGRIDGRMGKQTRDAIRAFQKANNLAVDGRVGRETWNLLKEYLYKKIK
ncbi:MAG TPA: peptidoglycan-binding domain-containing protein [Candidatus Omnitrophota bacterium]|nr:peptidoglycan-binding domain-containing protein [Candidatus Omnitrophota bacterium]